MRADLTQYGVEEARTPADVDKLIRTKNTVRPAIGLALQHSVRPATVATVFAGADEAAVAHLRGILSPYPPSSPSMALFQSGKPVYMLHRSEIERRDPYEIAELLKQAFDHFCASNFAAQENQPA
jgi:putative YphP/YqiW family bacilliredoxin